MLRTLSACISFMLLMSIALAQQSPAARSSDESLPAISLILEKYEKAVGDKSIAEKLVSVEMKGTIEVVNAGLSGTTETLQKAPDKQYQSYDLPGYGIVRTCYDGKGGWVQFPDGVRDASGTQLASMRRNALMLRDYMFKELYPKMNVKGKGKVGEHEVYIVEATPPEGSTETFYFNTQDGLLARIDGETEGPEGSTPSEMYFEDYRDVGGIRRPFTIRQSTSGYTVVIKLSEVKHDVPIEDSRFAKPADQ